ncbi:sensor histidine kinase [Kineosporia babensis]|uniref:histidine kinase n=1 Tax=Kineosporia babensis TaxID=499548 RepID=A0A9X1NAH3_9ACTN|nr:sensor histidine kinase [Kineosporia babensis]
MSRLRLAFEVGLVLVFGTGSIAVALRFTDNLLGGNPQTALGFAVLAFLAWAVVLPLRLVRPLTALVLGGLLSIPLGSTGLVMIPLSAAVGYRVRRKVPLALAYLAVFACGITGVGLSGGLSWLTVFLFALAQFSAYVVLPGTVGAMAAQRRLLVMTMHQRNVELHAERQAIEGQAQARERNRIAAELHDSLGHRLTLLSLYTGGLAQAPELAALSPERRQALDLVRDTSGQAMGELRQILKILHQDASDDAGGRSLAEVEETVASARATGTQVELVRAGEPRPLPLLAEHAAYRVVQEGLTNALKHAGGAPIRVEVRYAEEELFVEVRNGPGRPYAGQSSGQGLAGLAERVRLAGGVLTSGPVIDASSGGGFRISAVLPYNAEIPDALAPKTGDFPEEIKRNTRRQRLGVLTVITAVVLSLGSCVGALVVPDPVSSDDVAAELVSEPVSQQQFDELRIGEAATGLPEPWHTEESGGKVCSYYTAAADVESDDPLIDEIDFEFCFLDGKLVSKDKL